MNPFEKNRRVLGIPLRWLAGLLLASLALYLQCDLAQRKIFTEDEAFQHVVTCPESYSTIVIHGGLSQCSRPPLYYLLQKAYLGLVPFDEAMQVSFRALSLVSGFLTVFLMFGWIAARLEWASALFATLLLLSQPIFHQFAAESRPYAFWVLLYLAWLVILREGSRRSQAFLAASLTGVSAAGMLQALGGWLAEAFLVAVRTRTVRAAVTLLRPVGAVFFVLLAVGIYYSWHGCPPVPGGWNLLETRNPDLLLFVWRLLFPSGLFYYTWVLNGIVALGLIVAVFRAVRVQSKNDLAWEEALGFQLLAQLCIAFVIAVSVAIKGYFFVPRMFIFLVIVRSLLGAIGLHYLLLFLRQQWPAAARVWQRGIGGFSSGIFLLILAKTFQMNAFLRENSEFEVTYHVSHELVPCSEWRTNGKVWMKKGLSAGEAMNTWVAAAKNLASCSSNPGVVHVVLNGPRNLGHEYFVSAHEPDGTFEVYRINGDEVVFGRN